MAFASWLSTGCDTTGSVDNGRNPGGTDTPNLPSEKQIVGRTEPFARIYVLGTFFLPSDPARVTQPQPQGIAEASGLFRFEGSYNASYSMVAEMDSGDKRRKGCREDFFIPLEGLAWSDTVRLGPPVVIQGSLVDKKKEQLDSIGGLNGEVLEWWIGERGTMNYAKVDGNGHFKVEDVCFQRRHLRILRVLRTPGGEPASTPIAFDVPTCHPHRDSIVFVDTITIPATQASGSELPALECR